MQGLQEPSGSRLALKGSQKMNKDLKQNCREFRQSHTAQGSWVSWAEHLPGAGPFPKKPHLYKYTVKAAEILTQSQPKKTVLGARGGGAQNFL